jgi:replicative DNA helicase
MDTLARRISGCDERVCLIMTSLEPSQMPPEAQASEEIALGSILINPNLFHMVAATLKAEDFFILRNAWVFEAMQRLVERDLHPEYELVIEELRQQGRLEHVGGAAYITYLAQSVGTSMYGEDHAHVVHETASRRRLLEVAAEIAQHARDAEITAKEAISRAERAMFSVTERNLKKDTVPIGYALHEYFERFDHLYMNPSEVPGIPTGFTDLDNILGGFQKSDLLILAARPGIGKTSLMLNVAMNAAKNKARVGIFSLEMNKEQLTNRLLSQETGIDGKRLRFGRVTRQEYELVTEARTRLEALPLFMDDTGGLTLLQLRAKAQRLYHEWGLDLIIIDYLQLMGTNKGRNTNRTIELSELTGGLKQFARELDIPICAASQLSRGIEQRADKRPMLSDLRESGSIENDADVVMFIYRDDMVNENSERPNEADIIIEKHRNGDTGCAVLYFRKELTQFCNLAKARVNLEDPIPLPETDPHDFSRFRTYAEESDFDGRF